MTSKPEPEPEPEPLDFDRDIPTTPQDIAALRRIRESRRMSFADYLCWLSRYPSPFPQAARRKTHEGFPPFEL